MSAALTCKQLYKIAEELNLPVYCWGKATLSNKTGETPKLLSTAGIGESSVIESEKDSVMCNISVAKRIYETHHYPYLHANCDCDVILNTKEYRERSHVYIAFVDPVPASALPEK